MIVEIMFVISSVCLCKTFYDILVGGARDTRDARDARHIIENIQPFYYHIFYIPHHTVIDIDKIAPISVDVDKNKEYEECSICLEPFEDKIIRTTICGHTYCSLCIKKWLELHLRCPNCNKEFI